MENRWRTCYSIVTRVSGAHGVTKSDFRVIVDQCEDARLVSLSGTFGCSLLCLFLLSKAYFFVPPVCIKRGKLEDDVAKVSSSTWVPVRQVNPSDEVMYCETFHVLDNRHRTSSFLMNIKMTARGSHRPFEEPLQRSGRCPGGRNSQISRVGREPTRFQSTRRTASRPNPSTLT
jgi:hypothetical protein